MGYLELSLTQGQLKSKCLIAKLYISYNPASVKSLVGDLMNHEKWAV